MSVTTMESVFLKVITEDAEANEAAKSHSQRAIAVPENPSSPSGEPVLLEATTAGRDKKSGTERCCKHMLALYMKRLHYGKRDKSSIVCNTMIPIMLLLLSMEFLTSAITVETTPPMRMDYANGFDVASTLVPVHTTVGTDASKVAALRKVPSSEIWPTLTNSDDGMVFGVDYTAGCPTTDSMSTSTIAGRRLEEDDDDRAVTTSARVWGGGCAGTWYGSRVTPQNEAKGWTNNYTNLVSGNGNQNAEALAGPSLAFAQDIHADSMTATAVESVTFGAFVASAGAEGVGILVNTTARYAGPVMVNALSNGYAAAGTDGMEIKMNNAPLPVTGGMEKALGQFQNITAVLFIVIAFSFVPGAVIAFVVKEREAAHNCKHQQMISGVSISGYWIGSFLWDATLYCVPLTLAMIIIASYDLKAFTGSPCYDYNRTSSTYNPFILDFFTEPGASNCSDVIAAHGADQGYIEHYGSCESTDSSDVAAVTSCSSVELVGENFEWNGAACMAAGLAPTQWAACMASASCKASLAIGMAPGSTIGDTPAVSIYDLAFDPTAVDPLLTQAMIAAFVAQQQGQQDKCQYKPVFAPKGACLASNAYQMMQNPPGVLLPCEATLADVCQVTTDTCPISRTGAVFLLFWGYGLAIICWSYCLSYLFSSHTNAQIYSIILTFITGLVLMIVSLVLDTAFDNASIAQTNRTLKWFYRLLSPGFCLGNGLLTMAFSAIGITLGGADGLAILVGTYDPLSWDNAGRDVFFLFFSIPVFLATTILLQYIQTHPQLAGVLFKDKKVEDPEFEIDEDVKAEEDRVLRGDADTEAIKLCHLRKVYSKGETRGYCSGEVRVQRTSLAQFDTTWHLHSGLTNVDAMHRRASRRWLCVICPSASQKENALVSLVSMELARQAR